MAEPERIVVGGSIASLVAADELSGRGQRVRLLAPERGLGGGFASIRRDGRVLELGVRFLELAYEGVDDAPPPLAHYRPGVGAHRPYAALIERWVGELLGERVVEVGRPRMFFDGRMVDDVYFTTDPLALREALGKDERERIVDEAREAGAALGSDAGLLDDAHAHELERISAAEASRRNHGRTFHERVIAPMAEKVVAGGGEGVMAQLRRKIWMPLFWPATLAQACDGGEVAFRPKRPFHTVAPDGCGGLVDALVERIQQRGGQVQSAGRLERVASGADGDVELTFSAVGPVRAWRPVLGSAPGELFGAGGAAYEPDLARSVICWLEASPEDLAEVPSLVNVVDPEIPAVRVSSSGRGAPGTRLLTVEMRHDLLEEEIGRWAIAALHRTGLLREGADAHVAMSAAAATFPLPTRENAERFAHAQAAFAELGLDAEVVGGGTDFGADALGEQIVQGLRAAEALSR
jgi:NAD(P)-binding Rossmann-like domain